MAEEPIRKEDIIDIEGTQNSINELIALMEKLSTVIKGDLKVSADELIKSLQGVNAATKEGQELIKNASVQAENLAAQNKELTRLDKEKTQLKARLASLETNEANEVQKLRVAIERKNKVLKEAARLDDSAEGSVNKMRARLKELIAEYNRLAPAARNQVAPAIKKVTDELKKAESAIGNNTRNVGNYRQSILAAGKQLLSFAGITGGATVIVNKLKDAFFETERGANFLARSTAGIKAFFQSIIGGDFQGAGLKALAAIQIAKETNKIRIGDRKDLVEIAKMESEINILRYKSADATLSQAEQLKYLNLAQQKENELLDFKIKDKEEELANVQLARTAALEDITLMEKEAQLLAEIETIKGERSLRLETRASALRAAIAKKERGGVVEIERAKMRDVEEIKIQGLIKNKEFYEREREQIDKLTEYEIKSREQAEQEKREAIDDSFQMISNSLNIFGDLFEAAKQRELSAVGDNAKAREEIERKYAQKQQILSIGQALINGAMAITEIWRKWAANPVLAGIFTALSSAQTIAQVSIIKAQKFAKGGSGILEGAVHASGGVNIGIGEAERGEHIAVTSRAMTSRYGGKMLDAVSNSINQGKFFEVWANVNKSMEDPYTKKMYELMKKTPTVYTDTEGNTVKEYPNGQRFVIRRFYRN